MHTPFRKAPRNIARRAPDRPARALVVLGVVALAARALAQTTDDHLACYKVKDPAAKKQFSVTVSNAAVEATCTVNTPARLGCLGSSTSNIDPSSSGSAGPAGHVGNLLCYPMKCPKPFPGSADVTDELGGTRVIRFRAALFLCAPASGSPASTSTTTSTLPSSACDFDEDSGRCEGSCGTGGGRCSAVASGGACECRVTPCGDADAPECEGHCDSDEACVVGVDDCHCVAIP